MFPVLDSTSACDNKGRCEVTESSQDREAVVLMKIWAGENAKPEGQEIFNFRPWIDLGGQEPHGGYVPVTTHSRGGRPTCHQIFIGNCLNPPGNNFASCGQVGLPIFPSPPQAFYPNLPARTVELTINETGAARVRAKLRWALGLDQQKPRPATSVRGRIWPMNLTNWPELAPTADADTTLCLDVMRDKSRKEHGEWWFDSMVLVVPLIELTPDKELARHQIPLNSEECSIDEFQGLVADCSALLAVSVLRMKFDPNSRLALPNSRLAPCVVTRIDEMLEETFGIYKPLQADKVE